MRMRAQPDHSQISQSMLILEKSRREVEPYSIVVHGLSFIVLPKVFSPKYFGSTQIFNAFVTCRAGEHFLEMGCGTGVTSIVVARSGAGRVVAVDINPFAVKNCRLNAELHGVSASVSAVTSDLFEQLAGQQFDTIYWNTPWIPIEADYSFAEIDERALFDPGYRKIEQFVRECDRYLKPGGRVLVGFGDFGSKEDLFEICSQNGFTIKELGHGLGWEGKEVSFILYELRRS